MATRINALKKAEHITSDLRASKIQMSYIINDMEVEMLPLASIKLWKDNPRKNDKGVPALAEGIKRHGFRSPLVVWRRNMTIYKGNTTWKAAKLLGLKEVPCILADFPSEQAATAYGIDDNKLGELSGWDYDVLKKLMSSQGQVVSKVTSFSEKELGIIQKGIFSPVIDKETIPEYSEDEDTFEICIEVPPKDKDKILAVVNKALEGTGYAANIY